MPVPLSHPARRVALLLPLALIVGMLFASQASAHLYWGDFDNQIGRANEDGTEAISDFIPVSRTWDVAVSGSHVYWTNEATHTIGRANLDGTGVEPAIVTGLTEPTSLVVYGNKLYWSGYGEGSIGRANLDGSEAEPNFIPNVEPYFGIAAGGGYIFWDEEPGDIARAKIDGTEVDREFIKPTSMAYSLVAHGNYIYWGTETSNEIGRARLDGTEVHRGLITGITAPIAMTADADHLYFAEFKSADSPIARANLDGTDVEPEFITGPTGVFGLAVDPARPTLTNTASAPVTLGGGGLSDTATVVGGDGPTGTLTFSLHGPKDPTCSGAPVFTANAAVTAEGTFASPAYTPTEAGTYRWTASYVGDVGHAEAASACAEPPAAATVSPRPTLKDTASGQLTLGRGALTDAVAVTDAGPAGGTLTFRLYGPADPNCSTAPVFTAAQKVGGDGTFPSPPYVPTGVGTYRWSAAYAQGSTGGVTVAGDCAATGAATQVIPPNGFTTTLLRGRVKKRGIAKVLVRTQWSGTIEVSGPGIKTQTQNVGAAGGYRLPVVPRGAYLKHLVRHHRGFTRITVAFVPNGTEPSPAVSLKVRLARSAVAAPH